jgi:predicted GNAT superfamily acetyltransferase
MATTEAKTSIVIRDIADISEMRAVETLQKEIWGVADREIFPALALIPMLEVGGVLIGAFDRDRMVGFVFGFPGYHPPTASGRVILHSDMLAVRPEYRSVGLGYKLKLAQRDRALAKGIETISWTFDPLQSLNAYLNIGKLGVIADRYRVNYYGETTSFLHRSGTDRLWVTWVLNSERVKERIAADSRSEPTTLTETTVAVRVGDNEEPVSQPAALGQCSVAIEIPASINTLVRENVALAVRWREATRAAFTKLLADGFLVEEFYRVERNRRSVGVYLLNKERGKIYRPAGC